MAVITTPSNASGQIGLTGTSHDDVIHAYDYASVRQTHVYAGSGNDVINMYFGDGEEYHPTWNNQPKEYHGHHVRGGAGEDVFDFRSLGSVSGTVIGRIEDFDPSRDQIRIEGIEITANDLANGEGRTGAYSWKIVDWNGDYNDPSGTPQKWLLIDTNGGWVFYSLEGARVDLTGDGAANSGQHEGHFFTTAPPDFATMPSVKYVPEINVIPQKSDGSEYLPSNGGIRIDDLDSVANDVFEIIQGTGGDDVIAAGLNDDQVQAGGGDDLIWGGSGSDTVNGDHGHDTIHGGSGNDYLTGALGNDHLFGDEGDDVLNGWGGNDLQYGGNENDRLYGQQGNDTLNGGAGNDLLYASTGDDHLLGGDGNDYLNGGDENDHLNGGQGADTMTGGAGADLFEFKSGDLMDWDTLSGSWSKRNDQLDLITDFTIGEDIIKFDEVPNVNSISDLKAWKTVIDGNTHFTVQVRATNERFLVDTDDTTSWSQLFDAENFLFT
ncbi:calcium-binding protein [uncultured Tateyamaria sp.]|uniref:calcium-binding protein n=1 Tax=uncultured Tateyamaria sp. TaxID=455651 RepID=UPI002620DF17|nr:calcium-binding protein [uncultured Tateyamaria sp.]